MCAPIRWACNPRSFQVTSRPNEGETSDYELIDGVLNLFLLNYYDLALRYPLHHMNSELPW